MTKKKIVSSIVSFTTVLGLAMVGTAFADTPNAPQQNWQRGGPDRMMPPGGAYIPQMRPAISGTVSAVNGSVLTVTGRQGFGASSTQVSYTVDATNATVLKNNATSSVSAIAVGDTVMAQGTVNGTSVTATIIRDGKFGPMMGGRPFGGRGASSTPAFVGNGEPVVAGSAVSISGSTLTITNKSNVTYTIDTANATILKGNASSTLASITIGDNVIVQGTVNGTSIVASSVIDQPARPAQPDAPKSLPEKVRGFFGSIGGSIGGFFSHFFGF